MNKTAAIKHARETVSELYRFGDGWKFSTVDTERNAWIEHGPRDYLTARRWRAETLIHAATLAIHDDVEKADAAAHSYDGGPWTDYIA